IWRANGLRFEEEGEWTKVKKLDTIPVSVEIEVEGKYDETTASGAKSTSSDMVIEEVELISGGAFGTDGRVSAYGSIAIQQAADGTVSSAINNAYIQVNDLAGPKGAGRLNLKAGKSSFGLPFLADYQKAINNRYLAEKTLDTLTMGLRLVELNGIKKTEDEESWAPTHYYSLGVARGNVVSSHKFKSFYATYSVNFKERYSVGAILRKGYETDAAGTSDVEYNKFGVGAEAELGPVVLTAGWFASKYDTDPDKTNYLIEALYMPTTKIGFGARYDTLKEDGKKSAVATSVMARYNILTNAFAQLEFRGLRDGDLATGTNEKEKKVRLFLVTLF
ncbi:MAG: hypothetical protein IME99_01960, partial [Proteobacteria bacterium]|nr:hypothetical protein [Pseudomonadota bacterium]